jgi:hypothetical protein
MPTDTVFVIGCLAILGSAKLAVPAVGTELLYVRSSGLIAYSFSRRMSTYARSAHVVSHDQIKSVRFRYLRRPDRKSRGCHGRKPSRLPLHITSWLQSNAFSKPDVGAGIWLNSPQCALVYEECRFQRAVVPPKPHGSPGLVIPTAMIWKLDHRVGADQSFAGEPRAVPALARPAPRHADGRGFPTGDALIEATCSRSISLTRFNGSHSRKGDAEAIQSRWPSNGYAVSHYRPCRVLFQTNCDSSRYSADSHYM